LNADWAKSNNPGDGVAAAIRVVLPDSAVRIGEAKAKQDED